MHLCFSAYLCDYSLCRVVVPSVAYYLKDGVRLGFGPRAPNTLHTPTTPLDNGPVYPLPTVTSSRLHYDQVIGTVLLNPVIVASFDMKDLGDLHYFLGIEEIHTPDGILTSQRHYVLSMLFKFGMMECKSISTPLDRNLKLRLDSGKACDPKRF